MSDKINLSDILNKKKRQEIWNKVKREKSKSKKEAKVKRKREREELGPDAPPKQVYSPYIYKYNRNQKQ